MKLMLTGARNIKNLENLVYEIISSSKFDISEIAVSDGDRNMDRVSRVIAKRTGLKIKEFPIDREKGERASQIRRVEMCKYSDIIIALRGDGECKDTEYVIQVGKMMKRKLHIHELNEGDTHGHNTAN